MWTPTPPLAGRRTPRPGPVRVCVRSYFLDGSGGPASRRVVVRLTFHMAIYRACFVSSPPSRLGLPASCLCPLFVLGFFPSLSLPSSAFLLPLAPCRLRPPPPSWFFFAPCVFFLVVFFLFCLSSLIALPPSAPPLFFVLLFFCSVYFLLFVLCPFCCCRLLFLGGGGCHRAPALPARRAVPCDVLFLFLACVFWLWCALCWWCCCPPPSPGRRRVCLWCVPSRPPLFFRVFFCVLSCPASACGVVRCVVYVLPLGALLARLCRAVALCVISLLAVLRWFFFCPVPFLCAVMLGAVLCCVAVHCVRSRSCVPLFVALLGCVQLCFGVVFCCRAALCVVWCRAVVVLGSSVLCCLVLWCASLCCVVWFVLLRGFCCSLPCLLFWQSQRDAAGCSVYRYLIPGEFSFCFNDF